MFAKEELWYGDFGWHQGSTSLSDDEASTKMLWKTFIQNDKTVFQI
jgi:hypothetical protein